MEDLTILAQGCGDKLEQIGWANRVYHVRRRRVIEHDAADRSSSRRGWRHYDGDWEEIEDVLERDDVYLEPWHTGSGTIPEIFQVWRA
jgi:hypothetical protein